MLTRTSPFTPSTTATPTSFHPDDLRSWEHFHCVPSVTKDQVIASFPERILATGFKLDQLVVSRSSGSSGKNLDIAYDDRAMITYMLAGLRLYKMGFDDRPWHRQLYIYTSPYPLKSLFGLYPLHFVSTLYAHAGDYCRDQVASPRSVGVLSLAFKAKYRTAAFRFRSFPDCSAMYFGEHRNVHTG